MIGTINEAVVMDAKKVKQGFPVKKPEDVYHYCQKMDRVDLNDQILNYYTFFKEKYRFTKKAPHPPI